MANFSRVHEEDSLTVSSGATEDVVEDIPVSGYETVSLTVRSDGEHDFDASIVRKGYSADGAYGAADGGELSGISSSGNDILTVPEISVESPEVSIRITNNDASEHDYDVFVGGQSR